MARPARATDQVRYEVAYYALKPDITIIAPWREWDFRSREQLIAFAEAHQIPIAKDKRNEAPFSVDANLLHTSSEGKVLEDPAAASGPTMSTRAPSIPRRRRIRRPISASISEKGDATRDRRQEIVGPRHCWQNSTTSAAANGIGRLDLVENRFVGMKSRGHV